MSGPYFESGYIDANYLEGDVTEASATLQSQFSIVCEPVDPYIESGYIETGYFTGDGPAGTTQEASATLSLQFSITANNGKIVRGTGIELVISNNVLFITITRLFSLVVSITQAVTFSLPQTTKITQTNSSVSAQVTLNAQVDKVIQMGANINGVFNATMSIVAFKNHTAALTTTVSMSATASRFTGAEETLNNIISLSLQGARSRSFVSNPSSQFTQTAQITKLIDADSTQNTQFSISASVDVFKTGSATLSTAFSKSIQASRTRTADSSQYIQISLSCSATETSDFVVTPNSQFGLSVSVSRTRSATANFAAVVSQVSVAVELSDYAAVMSAQFDLSADASRTRSSSISLSGEITLSCSAVETDSFAADITAQFSQSISVSRIRTGSGAFSSVFELNPPAQINAIFEPNFTTSNVPDSDSLDAVFSQSTQAERLRETTASVSGLVSVSAQGNAVKEFDADLSGVFAPTISVVIKVNSVADFNTSFVMTAVVGSQQIVSANLSSTITMYVSKRAGRLILDNWVEYNQNYNYSTSSSSFLTYNTINEVSFETNSIPDFANVNYGGGSYNLQIENATPKYGGNTQQTELYSFSNTGIAPFEQPQRYTGDFYVSFYFKWNHYEELAKRGSDIWFQPSKAIIPGVNNIKYYTGNEFYNFENWAFGLIRGGSGVWYLSVMARELTGSGFQRRSALGPAIGLRTSGNIQGGYWYRCQLHIKQTNGTGSISCRITPGQAGFSVSNGSFGLTLESGNTFGPLQGNPFKLYNSRTHNNAWDDPAVQFDKLHIRYDKDGDLGLASSGDWYPEITRTVNGSTGYYEPIDEKSITFLTFENNLQNNLEETLLLTETLSTSFTNTTNISYAIADHQANLNVVAGVSVDADKIKLFESSQSAVSSISSTALRIQPLSSTLSSAVTLSADISILKIASCDQSVVATQSATVGIIKQGDASFEAINTQLTAASKIGDFLMAFDNIISVSITAVKTTDITKELSAIASQNASAERSRDVDSDFDVAFSQQTDVSKFTGYDADLDCVVQIQNTITKFTGYTADLLVEFTGVFESLPIREVPAALSSAITIETTAVKQVEAESDQSASVVMVTEGNAGLFGEATIDSEINLTITGTRIQQGEADFDSVGAVLAAVAKIGVFVIAADTIVTIDIGAVKTTSTQSNIQVATAVSIEYTRIRPYNADISSQFTQTADGTTNGVLAADVLAEFTAQTDPVKTASFEVAMGGVGGFVMSAGVNRTTDIDLINTCNVSVDVDRFRDTEIPFGVVVSFECNAGKLVSVGSAFSSAVTQTTTARVIHLDEYVYVIPNEITEYKIVSESREYKIVKETRLHKVVVE